LVHTQSLALVNDRVAPIGIGRPLGVTLTLPLPASYSFVPL